jgi:acetyl-CoA carboxylase biotin carboxyl carrier protein
MSDENETTGMRVNTDLIRQLADMLSENDLSEIEVEDGDRRIVVKRKLTVAAAPAMAAPTLAAPAPAAAAPAAELATSSESGGGEAVRSPMVGTAFLAGEPGAKPFVAAGQQVKAGDTLLIIEAMKVMNPITAPRAGTVSRICVADAQPVEFDQTLVLLD